MSKLGSAVSRLVRCSVLFVVLAPAVSALGDTLYVACGRPPKQSVFAVHGVTITDVREHDGAVSLFYDIGGGGSQIKPLDSIVRIEVDNNDSFNQAEAAYLKGTRSRQSAIIEKR